MRKYITKNVSVIAEYGKTLGEGQAKVRRCLRLVLVHVCDPSRYLFLISTLLSLIYAVNLPRLVVSHCPSFVCTLNTAMNSTVIIDNGLSML